MRDVIRVVPLDSCPCSCCFFLLCNPSHDSTVKNAGTQRYHFKHNFSQEPQILSVELNEDMLWWPTTESVAFKETCWWDCTVHPANWMSGTVFVPLRILLGVLIGGQICLTSTWVVIFCRFFGLPYLFFSLPSCSLTKWRRTVYGWQGASRQVQ